MRVTRFDVRTTPGDRLVEVPRWTRSLLVLASARLVSRLLRHHGKKDTDAIETEQESSGDCRLAYKARTGSHLLALLLRQLLLLLLLLLPRAMLLSLLVLLLLSVFFLFLPLLPKKRKRKKRTTADFFGLDRLTSLTESWTRPRLGDETTQKNLEEDLIGSGRYQRCQGVDCFSQGSSAMVDRNVNERPLRQRGR